MMPLAYTATGIIVTIIIWAYFATIVNLCTYSNKDDHPAPHVQLLAAIIAAVLIVGYLILSYRIGHFLLAPYIK